MEKKIIIFSPFATRVVAETMKEAVIAFLMYTNSALITVPPAVLAHIQQVVSDFFK
jgi:hypothetical protein